MFVIAGSQRLPEGVKVGDYPPRAVGSRRFSWHDVAWRWSTIPTPRQSATAAGSYNSHGSRAIITMNMVDTFARKQPLTRIARRLAGPTMAAALLLASVTFCPLPGTAFAKDDANAPEQEQIGKFIHIDLPITGQAVERITSMVRRGDRTGQPQQGSPSLDFRVRRAQGQKGRGQRQPLRRGPRPGRFPIQRRTQRRADRGLSSEFDPRTRRPGRHRLPRNHHGERRDARGGGR